MWNDPSELARLPFQLHTSMYKDTQDPSECKFALSPGENSTFLIQTISARNLRIELRTSDDRSRASMGDHPLLASVEASTIVDWGRGEKPVRITRELWHRSPLLRVLMRVYLFHRTSEVVSSTHYYTLPCCYVRPPTTAADRSTYIGTLYWVEDRPLMGSSLTSGGSLRRNTPCFVCHLYYYALMVVNPLPRQHIHLIQSVKVVVLHHPSRWTRMRDWFTHVHVDEAAQGRSFMTYVVAIIQHQK